MQKFLNLDQIQIEGPTFVTVGNFDGLHRGHQALLQQLQRFATQTDVAAVSSRPKTALITFDPHPLAVLRPDQAQPLLTTPDERLELAAQLGIDIGVIQPFTHELAKLEAREFIQLLKDHLGLAAFVVGPDFALGRGRQGDLHVLRELGLEFGYVLHVVAPSHWQGKSVRSSLIRQAVQTGDVAEAADLLGRAYPVVGEVIKGDQRGRQIGIPTANLRVPADKLWPAYGVYATWARLPQAPGSQRYASVTNLGVRPTVGGVHPRFETHLLDFPREGGGDDLYGRQMIIEFVARLRGEQRFASLEALVTQIHADIVQARQLLAT